MEKEKRSLKRAIGSKESEVKKVCSDLDLDIEKLRLSQQFNELVGVKKRPLAIPVRKPPKQTFVRVHPGEENRFETAVLELKENREIYLVDSSLWSELSAEIKPVVLFTAVTRHGDLFLWPVGLPDEHGRHNHWHRSLLEAAQQAMRSWVRVTANMSLGAYDAYEATANLPEPEWPDLSLEEILKIAFRDKFIQSFDHPVVKELRGEL